MSMTAQQALQLVATALAAAEALQTALPEIEANWEKVKAAYAATSAADLQALIDQAHADIQALGAKLDALKDG